MRGVTSNIWKEFMSKSIASGLDMEKALEIAAADAEATPRVAAVVPTASSASDCTAEVHTPVCVSSNYESHSNQDPS